MQGFVTHTYFKVEGGSGGTDQTGSAKAGSCLFEKRGKREKLAGTVQINSEIVKERQTEPKNVTMRSCFTGNGIYFYAIYQCENSMSKKHG
jgi:hypothetical protein